MADSAFGRIQADPTLKALYRQLLAALDELGEYDVETRKSSLQITHGLSFLGVRAGTTGLLLTLVTDSPIASDRVRRVEQTSAGRCHNEVLVSDAADFDADLKGWLDRAYDLTA